MRHGKDKQNVFTRKIFMKKKYFLPFFLIVFYDKKQAVFSVF